MDNYSSNNLIFKTHWLVLVGVICNRLINILLIGWILWLLNIFIALSSGFAISLFVIVLIYSFLQIYYLIKEYWSWLLELVEISPAKIKITRAPRWHKEIKEICFETTDRLIIEYPNTFYRRFNLGKMIVFDDGTSLTLPLMRLPEQSLISDVLNQNNTNALIKKDPEILPPMVHIASEPKILLCEGQTVILR